MKKIMALLAENDHVSDYKINVRETESYELFFVKGKLETVRKTDTCDKAVTVYVDHGECKGDSRFLVYPSTSEAELRELIEKAVAKAKLLDNQYYTLPEKETGEFEVESNFREHSLSELADIISKAVFRANDVENAALNSVEIFVNRHTDTVINSRGIHKTQVRYDAMVEAIPTYNGPVQSVELYEQYNFSSLDENAITQQIHGKLLEVKDRYEAVKPEAAMDGNVILNKQELSKLFDNVLQGLNYFAVYSHSNLFKKGDWIQKAPSGDKINIRAAGQVSGNISSAKFDEDGISLGSIELVRDGQVVNYYGANRFGQYLGERPTGNLKCLCVDGGADTADSFREGRYLEVISMSGLQVDFYNDYIGGEVRLAYYHDGSTVTPVTGISITGSLSQALNTIRLSRELAVHNQYVGPQKALLRDMKIF